MNVCTGMSVCVCVCVSMPACVYVCEFECECVRMYMCLLIYIIGKDSNLQQ